MRSSSWSRSSRSGCDGFSAETTNRLRFPPPARGPQHHRRPNTPGIPSTSTRKSADPTRSSTTQNKPHRKCPHHPTNSCSARTRTEHPPTRTRTGISSSQPKAGKWTCRQDSDDVSMRLTERPIPAPWPRSCPTSRSPRLRKSPTVSLTPDSSRVRPWKRLPATPRSTVRPRQILTALPLQPLPKDNTVVIVDVHRGPGGRKAWRFPGKMTSQGDDASSPEPAETGRALRETRKSSVWKPQRTLGDR